MPHAIQNQLADEPTHAMPPAVGHDDDRGAAQRASLAGLRREATQLPGAQDAERQHSKADTASYQALQSSMSLVTAKLLASRQDIEQLIGQPMTMAGTEPARQAITAIVEERVGDVIALDMHMGLHSDDKGPNYGLTSQAHMLTRELGGLETVAGMFIGAVKHAETAISDLALDRSLAPIDQRLNNLRDKIGLSRGEPITTRVVERRPAQVVRTEAIEDNLRAVLEAARAVRAGAGGKGERAASGDLQMMLRHVAELDTLVSELTDRAALHKLAPRLRHMLDEVHAVGEAVRNTPALDLGFHHSATLPGHLRSLRAKASA